VDKVPDSAGCINYSYCWLKGVGVVFLLKKGLLESSSDYYKRLEVDIMAVITAIGTEVDSVDYYRGK